MTKDGSGNVIKYGDLFTIKGIEYMVVDTKGDAVLLIPKSEEHLPVSVMHSIVVHSHHLNNVIPIKH